MMNYGRVSRLIMDYGINSPAVDKEFMSEPFLWGCMLPGMNEIQKIKEFKDLLEPL